MISKIDKPDILMGVQACLNEYEGVPWFAKHKCKREKIFDREEVFSFGVTQGHIGWLGNDMYIIFRGSDEKGDWWGPTGNFNIRHMLIEDRVPLTKKIETRAWLFEGFWRAYKLTKTYILETVENTNPGTITVCGHSAGGARAAICAENLAFLYPNKKIYGIYCSSPRPGGAEFRDIHNERVDAVMVYIIGDIVCLTPCLMFGARSVGRQIGYWKWTFPPVAGPHYPFNLLQATKDSK